jgi:predicted HTH transcriptional regulator
MTSPFIESAADFTRLVQPGVRTESITLDFKRDLDGWRAPDQRIRREAAKELARDIAQFANTSGGCLLVGVEEAKVGGKKVANAVRPLDDFDGSRQWVEQAITNFLVPSTISVRIAAIEIGGATIMAVNVPAHEHLVWVWDRQDHTMESLRRTSHGKEWLNPDETAVVARVTDAVSVGLGLVGVGHERADIVPVEGTVAVPIDRFVLDPELDR